jgi:hypothetical protein
MGRISLTIEEAFEMREALEKLEKNKAQLPISFSWPIMRNKRVLDRAYRDYQKALRKSRAAIELERFNEEQIKFLDEHLKKDHLGNYEVQGEGQGRQNIPKDPAKFEAAKEEFWARWPNLRELQQERLQEEIRYKEQEFDDRLYIVKFRDIPLNLEPEYISAILPLVIDAPDEISGPEEETSQPQDQIKEAAD